MTKAVALGAAVFYVLPEGRASNGQQVAPAIVTQVHSALPDQVNLITFPDMSYPMPAGPVVRQTAEEQFNCWRPTETFIPQEEDEHEHGEAA